MSHDLNLAFVDTRWIVSRYSFSYSHSWCIVDCHVIRSLFFLCEYICTFYILIGIRTLSHLIHDSRYLMVIPSSSYYHICATTSVLVYIILFIYGIRCGEIQTRALSLAPTDILWAYCSFVLPLRIHLLCALSPSCLLVFTFLSDSFFIEIHCSVTFGLQSRSLLFFLASPGTPATGTPASGTANLILLIDLDSSLHWPRAGPTRHKQKVYVPDISCPSG